MCSKFLDFGHWQVVALFGNTRQFLLVVHCGYSYVVFYNLECTCNAHYQSSIERSSCHWVVIIDIINIHDVYGCHTASRDSMPTMQKQRMILGAKPSHPRDEAPGEPISFTSSLSRHLNCSTQSKQIWQNKPGQSDTLHLKKSTTLISS